MAIDVQDLKAQPLAPEVAEELDKFEDGVTRYLAGEIDEDIFRVFRLNQGIYGQRQGGHNQMLRVKVPHGSLTPEQLEMFGHIADEFSRGWGHLTTRQNVQFHFVQLEQTPEVLRRLASVDLTSREACGDTVRNVTGCHLAGACPFEVLDISPWAQATTDFFLRNPYAQRLPRKFKINFSGCVTDCGQAMFNDIGVIAVNQPRPDGTVEAGFKVFIAGGLGANPHPALALEEFTPREQLMPTLEALVRVFDHYGNRDNKLRARMKWLVDTMGIDELRERVFKERKFLPAASSYQGGLPEPVQERGDAPAGMGDGPVTQVGASPVKFLGLNPYEKWESANVVRGRANGTVSAYAYCRLGDITSDQFRALADIQREFGFDVRVTNRQNFALRGLTEEQLNPLYARLLEIGMAEPGAELARDVVACPGADTCNLAVTQSRGLADDIGRALEMAGLAEVGGIRVNISGCTNSCGQHHISDIGFVGIERRAHGRAAPGYQMLLGGQVGHTEIDFGEKAVKLPAKRASEAVVRVVGRFANEREAGETFGQWLDRAGGAADVGKELKDLDSFPPPDEAPDFYTDFDETGPYVAEVGASEWRDMSTTVDTDLPDLAKLAEISASFENAPASEVVAWAWEQYGSDIVLAMSGQDCVLLDMAIRVALDIEVVFLDTQYHFPETMEYMESLQERYGMNLTIMTPEVEPDDRWADDPDGCCAARKIEPLRRALDGKSAWMTGLRRSEAATRAKAPIVSYDISKGLVKVNPLATWTDLDVEGYARDRGLPLHPLREQGYKSIGCWPCTQPVADGEHSRNGRWAGTDKIECGLHG